MEMTTKIALIDDNKELLNTYKLYFDENTRYNIEYFSDSQEALKSILVNKHDIIVTDNIMPNIDGIELAKRVLVEYSPYIILASVMSKRLKKDELFDLHLNKPVDYKLLSNHLHCFIQEITIKKDKILQNIIDNLFVDTGCSFKDKIFLEQVVKGLLYDYDVPLEGSLYQRLQIAMQKDQSVIRKKLNQTIEQTYSKQPSLFEKIFGFKTKPKNKEFVDKLIEKVTQEYERR